MANEAEVDLVVNASNALPDLERQLQRIVSSAEDSAPDVALQAGLDARNTLRDLDTALSRVISAVEADPDSTIDVSAAVDQRTALRTLDAQIGAAVAAVTAGAPAVDIEAALDVSSVADLRRDVDNVVETLTRTADPVEVDVELDRDIDGQLRRLTSGFDGLGDRARSAAGPIGGLVGTIGRLGATVGAAVPAVSALAGAVQQLGPAAAVAVSGMVTMRVAASTLKIAMIGVSDAVSAAFDPETKPEELAEAMERLAPNAKAFVTELASMKSGLQEIQQEVQNRVFDDLDKVLRTLAKATLPEASRAVKNVGDSFNEMAKNAAAGALALDANGALGKALKGSEEAMRNLEQVPNDLVVSLGTIAAAGAPALDRLTKAAAGAADQLSDRLVAGFNSGALTQQVNQAVDAVVQLGSSFGDVFAGIGNILSTADTTGGGFLDTIESIAAAFRDVTATKGFQDAITALSQTMAVVVDTVLPILALALQTLGPIFEALGPPIQAIVEALGAALTPIVAALGPVLVALADAVGQLVPIFTPFLEVVSSLITTLLPALIPLFDALFVILGEIAPAAEMFATMLGELLTPIIQELGPLLDLVLDPLVELYSAVFPAIIAVLLELQPSLMVLSEALVEVLEAAGPLIKTVLELALTLGKELAPLIQPLVKLLLGLVEGGLKVVAGFITTVIVPAIEVLTKLLQGRFSDAWNQIKNIVGPAVDAVVGFVRSMVTQSVQLLGSLFKQGVQFATNLAVDFGRQIQKLVADSIRFVSELPGKILQQATRFGSLLVQAGKDIINGLIRGLKSMLGSLLSTVSDIGSQAASSIKDFFGISSPSKLMMGYGKDVMRGFIIGIAGQEDALKTQMDGIAAIVAPGSGLRAAGFDPLSVPSSTLNMAASQQPVTIHFGNEFLARYVDGRVTMIDRRNRRIMAQGVRP
ncbi:hypothetical protein ACI2LJ_27830 [Streptomyces sp. NPDC088090]|uniref:phage tail protein n=1 Tax=Streptomyces sp. NPDC088090 TaxID=3365822 RepID=UPI0038510EDD